MTGTPQTSPTPTTTFLSDYAASGFRTLPDFAELYPATRPDIEPDELTDDDHVALTAREAYLLHAACELLADQLDDDVEDLLPAPAVTAAADETWRAAFIAEVGTVRERLAAGQAPYPTNTAQEMILHLLLDIAPDWVDTLYVDPDAETAYFDALVEADSNPSDLRGVIHGLVQDIDVLMLFDSPEYAAPGYLLHPDNWFQSFSTAA